MIIKNSILKGLGLIALIILTLGFTTPEEDIERGKNLYVSCIPCHGDKAQGLQSMNSPALVNQDSWYLERQLQNFKNGLRGTNPNDTYGAQMAPMANTLTDAQAVKDVVAYIKTLPAVDTKKTIEGNIEKGQDYYNMICGGCHGPEAKGNEILNSPKLKGIDDWYLERQFHGFKLGYRGTHPDDKFGFQMKLMTKVLPTDEDIKDVVAYIQSLQN